MSFFRELRYESKWMFEEIFLLFKHPTRKQTLVDINYHVFKIWNILFGHPWYCLKRGIRNLYIWFPTIWKNDCWDYNFLLELMDKQMKEMEDFFGSDKPVIMKAKQVHKRIKWTRKLMQMWRDEHYVMLEYNKHCEKFPKEDFLDSKVAKVDEYGVPVLYTCTPLSIESANDFRNHSDIGHKMDKKVFDLFLKNFSRCREWWD